MAFRPYWRRSLIARPPLLIAYGIALAALIGVVAAAAGPLAGPVAVYGASLAVMAVLATGVQPADRHRRRAVPALRHRARGGASSWRPARSRTRLFVNMALYLPAQLMITLGVLQRGLGGGRVEVVDPVA